MQKLIIAILLLSSILYLQYKGDDDDIPPGIYDSFTHYEKDYNKVYETPQIRSYRLHVFYKNVLYIQDFMDDFEVTYYLGYTPFTDFTTEEFQTIYLQNLPAPVYAEDELKVFQAEFVKDSVDWRGSGIVSDVPDTGACSATWAFSTTGVIESALRQKGQKGLNLSEQQLLDCSNDAVYTQGCAGGWPKQAYQWVQRNGAVTEAEYPYVGKQQPKCSKFTGTIKTSLFDVVKPDKSGLNLKIAVNKRPVSVCFDASNLAMLSEGTVNKYCSGKPNACGLLVGYDEYGWIVRMPWGPLWGEEGYVQIDPEGGCGLYDHAIIPQD